MSTTPLHVLIIGAGTGGLCLAHGLKRAGISVAVYERDRTRTGGLQGYRVGIDPDGSRALHAIHKPVIGRAVLAGTRTGIRVVNHLSAMKKRMLDAQQRDRGAERESLNPA
jgi:2-polyprenyl-6-methoxyphenol hydroxylase-like FAD-dependent oxidoreductase